MASIIPHKGKWRAHVYLNNKRRSKVFNNKRDAEQWVRITEFELASQVSDGHTFKQLLEHYRDTITPKKRGHRWEFVRIEAFLSGSLPTDAKLSEITSERLGIWRDERLKVVSAGTVLRDFSLLSAIFEHARRELKWIKENPVKDVRKPRSPDHRDVVITWQQVKAICKALGYSPTRPVRTVSQSVALSFLLALRTGMRAGELTSLTWDRCHDTFVQLYKTKTVPRDVPLSKKARLLLNKASVIDDKSVFLLSPQTLDSVFRKARSRAGIEGITFHDSRHTAATWMAHKVDVLTLCKIFGWKSTSQALTYYNPKAQDIAKLL